MNTNNSDTRSNAHEHCVICNATITENDSGLCDEHKYDEQLTSPTQSDKTVELRSILQKLSYDSVAEQFVDPVTDVHDIGYVSQAVEEAIAALTAREERMVREATVAEAGRMAGLESIEDVRTRYEYVSGVQRSIG